MSSLSGDTHSPLLCWTQVLDLTSHFGYLIFQTLWWGHEMVQIKRDSRDKNTTTVVDKDEKWNKKTCTFCCVLSKTTPFTVTMSDKEWWKFQQQVIFHIRRKRNSAWSNKINQSRLASPTLLFKHTYLGIIRTMCKGLLEESAVVVSACALSHLTEAWH